MGSKQLISTITKITILLSISISSTIIVTIIDLIILSSYLDTMFGWFILGIFKAIDIYANFICVFLSLETFYKIYFKICGCADKKCKQLCNGITTAHEIECELGDIISNKNVSKTKIETSSNS